MRRRPVQLLRAQSRLVLSQTGVAELGAQSRQAGAPRHLRGHQSDDTYTQTYGLGESVSMTRHMCEGWRLQTKHPTNLPHCQAQQPECVECRARESAATAEYEPEEGVVFHACLPQLFGLAVTGQSETDGGQLPFEFAGADLDVEVVTLIGDLQNLWPRKPVNPQPEMPGKQ